MLVILMVSSLYQRMSREIYWGGSVLFSSVPKTHSHENASGLKNV